MRNLSKKHFVHMRGVSFVLKHVNPMDLEGAIIFLKMIIVHYRLKNGFLEPNQKSQSLAILANTPLDIATLVFETLKNESLQNQIEAAQFLNKIQTTILKNIDHWMP